MRHRSAFAAVLALLLLLLGGCVASRSPLEGRFDKPTSSNRGAPPIAALFVFRHTSQMHGFDSIPKLQSGAIKDFDNLIANALREFGNLQRFETFTELPGDVYDPKRREALSDARARADFVVEVDLAEESSFRQQCFSGTISLLTLTLVPMPYDWNYTFRARVFGKDGKQVANLERRATLTSWVEIFLMFAYPWHPYEGKREEVYSESLHDLFRQFETQRVFGAAAGG